MQTSDIIFLSEPLETIPWLIQMVTISFAFVILLWKDGGQWGRRKKIGRMVFEGAMLLMLFLIASLLLVSLFKTYFHILWNIFLATVLAVYLWKFSSYNSTAKIAMWCSMYAGMQVIMALAGESSYLAGLLISPGLMEAVMRSATYILLILLAIYLVAFNFDDFEKIPPSGLLQVIGGNLTMLLLCTVTAVWSIGSETANVHIQMLAAYICLLSMVALSIYALYTICKDHETSTVLKQRQTQLLNERDRFAMAEQQIEEIRRIRHDLKNQRHYMRILLEEGHYEELKRYFDEQQDFLPVVMPFVNCGNNSVNVILNMEFAKIGAEIQLEPLLVVPPHLPFPDDELCSVLTNLLDNAMEECRQVLEKGIEKPVIRFEMYPQANFLYILCENTTIKTKLTAWRNGLLSTKEDQFSHGYGTQIVAKIAEKYEGCAEYSLKDGKFIAKILMDMMGERGC